MGSDKTCRYEGGAGRPDVRLYSCGDSLYSEAVTLKKTHYGVGKNARFFCTDFKEKIHSTGCTRKSNLVTRAGHCTAATLNGRRLNRSCGGLKGFLTRPKSGLKEFCFGSEEKKWASCSTSLVKGNAKLLGEDEHQLLARGGSSASVDCVPKLAGDAKCGWVTYKKVSSFFTTTEGWKCPKVGGGQKCHGYGGSCFDAEFNTKNVPVIGGWTTKGLEWKQGQLLWSGTVNAFPPVQCTVEKWTRCEATALKLIKGPSVRQGGVDMASPVELECSVTKTANCSSSIFPSCTNSYNMWVAAV